jgi:hypothetical protein
MIHLRWAKAKDGWLPLALPWPSVIDTVGVYVIWHEGNPSRVVRVGHGEIRERLHYHQEDPEVLAYSTLRVTWAAVQSDQMEGVECYLVEHWKPLVEDRPPKVVPIAVNSPFGASRLDAGQDRLEGLAQLHVLVPRPRRLGPRGELVVGPIKDSL